MHFILIYFLLLTVQPCFADKPVTGLDKEPSVDTAAAPTTSLNESRLQAQIPADENEESLDKSAPVDTMNTYVYDLKKLIIKSRENIRRVNDKIKEQAVIKRNQKREERAREYYEQGLKLQEEGKFDQAREYFEKAINITEHPEMAKYIDQSATKLKAQEAALRAQEKQQLRLESQEKQSKLMDAAKAYEEAVAFYKEKKFKEAKEMFAHVQELSENYKGTQSYLKIIDQNIIQAEVINSKITNKELARQEEEAQKARDREKQAWLKEIDNKEKERKTQVNAQAGVVYDEAVALYKNKKFMEAKKKFQDVEWVVPDYKATRNYIARADKDMAIEQARIDAIKAKELAQQQWEEEVARRKKEVQDKKEAEIKEKQRIKQLEEQEIFVYQLAVSLFDKKSYDEALEKFNDIEKTLPGFKSTKVYIAKIAYIKEKERQQKEKALEEEAKRKQAEEERKKAKGLKEQKNIQKQADKQEAKIAHHAAIEKTPQVTTPVQTKEQEIQDAKIVEDLARQSAKVLGQISSLAQDKRMAPVKKSMQKVDDILNRIRADKEKIFKELRAQEEKERIAQEKLIYEQKMEQVKARYDNALMFLRNQNHEQALTLFLAIESDMPNYKQTRWYLSHIKGDKQDAERQAVLERTHKEEDRLKELEEKQRLAALAQKAAKEQREKEEAIRKQQLRQAQESEIQALADKAVSLNDAIIDASRAKDFQTAKTRFADLEKVLETLQALKRTMEQEDQKEEFKKQVAKPKPLIEIVKVKPATKLEAIKKEDIQAKMAAAKARQQEIYDQQLRIKAEHKALEKAKREEADYSQDEMRREKEEVFDHAVSLYKQHKFSAAKIIFDDLSSHDYPGAKSYSRKIERYYEKIAAKVDASHERERTEFIQEQIRKQKLANVLAQQERSRQKGLSAQLERQRRAEEDQHQRQKIKIETMRLKERERERLEQKRINEQNKRKKEEESMKFRKIAPAPVKEPVMDEPLGIQVEKVKPEPVVEIKKIEEVKDPIVDQEKLKEDTEKAKQEAEEKARQEQLEFSKKRKEHFEAEAKKEEKAKQEAAKKEERAKLEQAKKEELAKLEEARKAEIEKNKKEAQERKEKAIKEKQEAQEARKKEKEAAIERKKQELLDRQKKQEEKRLQIQKEKERAAAARIEEQRRKEELRRQQEQEAIERQKREELQRITREKQKKLEDERKAIQQQLTNSAIAIYEDGIRLYNQGNYAAAYNKFKDLEDVLPDFKQTRKYLSQAKMNLSQSNLTKSGSATSNPKEDTIPPVNREDSIKKTLEVFDTP